MLVYVLPMCNSKLFLCQWMYFRCGNNWLAWPAINPCHAALVSPTQCWKFSWNPSTYFIKFCLALHFYLSWAYHRFQFQIWITLFQSLSRIIHDIHSTWYMYYNYNECIINYVDNNTQKQLCFTSATVERDWGVTTKSLVEP